MSETFSLGSSYVNKHFQIVADIYVRDNIYSTVKYCATIIYNWAKKKFPSLELDERIRSGSRHKYDQRVDTIYNIGEAYFCMIAEHSDASVPGRIWTVEAEIFGEEEKVKFGVRVLYTTPTHIESTYPAFDVPRFVKDIDSKVGILDIRRIGRKPKYIRSEEEIFRLYELLTDPDRLLPIVVVAENSETNKIGSAYLTGYLVSVEHLAQKIGLISHVYGLSKECLESWNDLFKENFGVKSGCVRTYNISFDEERDTAKDHPFTSLNKIMAASYVNDLGEDITSGEAYEIILSERIIDSMQRKRIDWKNLGFKYYFAANRELMKNRILTSSDSKEQIQNYKEQIEELEKKIEEQENEIITAWQEREVAERLLEEEKRTTYQQSLRIDGLIDQLNGKGIVETIELPHNYGEMNKWVDRYFPGKIVLHSRAKRNLKDAEFEDVQLVYKCLMLLGNEYYLMKQGLISLDECNSKCRELGVEIAGSIADERAGELGDTYFVEYHQRRIKLDMHIKKGKVTRDPKKCLRIYFFWDEESERVVIGSLPQHLQIRSS